jgi:hypothetical protein
VLRLIPDKGFLAPVTQFTYLVPVNGWVQQLKHDNSQMCKTVGEKAGEVSSCWHMYADMHMSTEGCGLSLWNCSVVIA